MNELLIQVIGGLIVVVVAAWFGISGTTKVTIQSSRVKKTGKK